MVLVMLVQVVIDVAKGTAGVPKRATAGCTITLTMQ